VPERVEQRQPDKPAAQQKVQGVRTPVETGQAKDVPPDTQVELTGVMKVLKSVDNALA
ncbi:adenine glycosylase, partial [Vibrio campbellii]|nr:adenine glycosylase [Vibrio campbellii]